MAEHPEDPAEQFVAQKLLGAVLTGGASRRMGRDKALVVVDGVAMVDRVASALSARCVEVVAIGPPELAGSCRAVDDRWPGQGPLGAILTALAAAGDDDVGVFVAACDLLALDAVTVTALADAFASQPEGDVVVATAARLEPLCSVWRPRCAPSVQRAFDGGERAVHRVFACLRTITVAVDGNAVRNANTPDELASG